MFFTFGLDLLLLLVCFYCDLRFCGCCGLVSGLVGLRNVLFYLVIVLRWLFLWYGHVWGGYFWWLCCFFDLRLFVDLFSFCLIGVVYGLVLTLALWFVAGLICVVLFCFGLVLVVLFGVLAC